jgi:hypothetical protein
LEYGDDLFHGEFALSLSRVRVEGLRPSPYDPPPGYLGYIEEIKH